MTRLINKKILLILAVWFLSGGLAFADSFDLSDELQNSRLSGTQALETDLDEVREPIEHGRVPATCLCPLLREHAGSFRDLPTLSAVRSQAASRPLHKLLRTFRI